MSATTHTLPDQTEIAAELAAAVVLIRGINHRAPHCCVRDDVARVIRRLEALAASCYHPSQDWEE